MTVAGSSMIVRGFLKRHWGKLLLSSLLFLILCWFFDIHPINSSMEFLGFNSPRMVRVQEIGSWPRYPSREHISR